MEPMLLAVVGSTLAAFVLAVALLRASKRASGLAERFAPVLNAEKEAARIREAAASSEREAADARRAIEANLAETRSKYALGLKKYDELVAEVSKLEENLETIDAGLYRPHFTYADSETYKSAIEHVRQRQKDAIRDGTATDCNTTWTVGGSKREGERMVKQTEKLILRAFNAASEAAVSNVTWNNYSTMRARIEKAFDALNKHGTVLQVSLRPAYRDLRLEELQLVYEAAEKKREEREEQRQQRAAQREEEAVQRELQKAQEEAEKEETKFAKALAKAQAELAEARETEREAMLARIAALESDLAAAHDRKERAMAQAQLTKVGHVYIISNIGAFGERVLKIGMTRRLEPEERIMELGDASVPFPFDVHALIYSENAPGLEKQLHDHFWDRRLNWANDRKEFFKLDLAELQAAIASMGLKTELQVIAEAREYRETVAALSTASKPVGEGSSPPAERSRFPQDPFA